MTVNKKKIKNLGGWHLLIKSIKAIIKSMIIEFCYFLSPTSNEIAKNLDMYF